MSFEHDMEARAILAAAGHGDREALANLYRRFERPLYRYLVGLCSDAMLAEEILQDTFVSAWTSASTFEGRSTVMTWLFGVARRQAHEAMRRKHLVEIEADETIEDSAPGPEAIVLQHAETRETALAIQQLAPIHREVLLLAFVTGLSYEEIAAVTQVPIGTVRSRLSNARNALRVRIKRLHNRQRSTP